MTNVSTWFLRLAAFWMVIGIAFGIHMGASGDHSLKSLHAHINLLGWASMAIFALVYRVWPVLADTVLAKLHFFIYVVGHLVQMVLLFVVLKGNPGVEPALGIISIIVGIGVLCFAINIWKNTSVEG